MNDRRGTVQCIGQLPPPCPGWCQLEPGHAYDSIDHDGNMIRSHERVIAESFDVSVAMVQSETAGAPDGAADPELHMEAEGVPLTGSQARQLAGWLLVAADEWEEART
jgi:hypothetical protein